MDSIDKVREEPDEPIRMQDKTPPFWKLHRIGRSINAQRIESCSVKMTLETELPIAGEEAQDTALNQTAEPG